MMTQTTSSSTTTTSYRFADEVENWVREYPSTLSVADVFAAEKEEYMSLLEEGQYVDLKMYERSTEKEVEEEFCYPGTRLEFGEFLEGEFFVRHPDPPPCVDGDGDEDDDQAHNWGTISPRAGRLEVQAGHGLAMTYTDQCQRCGLIREDNRPNNLPHNGAQNVGEYSILTYSQPEYSTWLFQHRNDWNDEVVSAWQVEVEKPARRVDETLLFVEQREKIEDDISPPFVFELFLIHGKDEEGDLILEFQSGYSELYGDDE